MGPRIAWGRSHSVYRYGTDWVIKFPLLERWIWPKLQERLERDISISRQYLGEYFLDTRIVRHPISGAIATLQPYLVGHYLCRADLDDEDIKGHFEEFIDCHERMVKAGYAPIELIGHGGVLRRRLSNILVTEGKKLRVIDAALLDMMGVESSVLIFLAPLLIALVLKRQNSTLRFLSS